MKLRTERVSSSCDSFSSANIEALEVLESSTSPRANINSLYSTIGAYPIDTDSISSSVSGNNSSGGESDLEVSHLLSSKKMKPLENMNEDDQNFIRGRPSACVFVASLCSNMTDDELCISVTNHFQKWGKLATVKVLRDTCNRPYAFVQYTKDEDSRLAIEEGHNSILDGRNIRCEAAKVNRTLFISSKSFFSEELIRDRLSEFGEIEELVPSNSKGGIFVSSIAPRGYKHWFCKFVYRDDAIRAFANLTEENLYRVDWAQNIDKANSKNHISFRYNSQSDDNDENLDMKLKFDKYSIFVGHLNSETQESDLQERFERHGTISEMNLVKKPNNTFAFIKYQEESSAASAVERENHSMFCGKTMHVQYREVHLPASKATSFNGVALAPPPINLSKRLSPTSNRVSESSRFHSNTKSSYEISKPKFNNYPSNSYNKGFNRGGGKHHLPGKYFNSFNRSYGSSFNNDGLFGWNSSGASSYNKNKPGSKSFDSKSKIKNDYYTWSVSNPTQLDLHGESPFKGFPASSRDKSEFKSKRGAYGGERTGSSGIGNKFDHKDMNNSSRGSGSQINNSSYPLFYYFPNNEYFAASSSSGNIGHSIQGSGLGPMGGSTNVPGPAPYYNIYQQYYPSYDPTDYPPPTGAHASFAIPNYMYYPTESEIASNEKKT
ncbi:Meiotic activator RIM4 [Spathaspora sp. JA1]|nr:Meiotic activator RIM4 [Spathaspora sp. JA1]